MENRKFGSPKTRLCNYLSACNLLIIKERGFLRVLSGCVNGEVISKALRVRVPSVLSSPKKPAGSCFHASSG